MLKFHAADNRRIGQRLHAHTVVKVAILHKSIWHFLFGRSFTGILTDISVQGVQIALRRPVDKGALLKIWVPVEYQKKNYNLALHGEVMWSKPDSLNGRCLVGIKLMDLSSPEMQIWAASTLDEIRNFQN